MAALRTDRRLYVTADRSRIVEEGDPAGAFLLVGRAGVLSVEDVQRYRVQRRDGRIIYPGYGIPEEEEPREPETPEVPDAPGEADAPQAGGSEAPQGGSEADAVTAQHVGGGWYELPDGSKVRKADLPADAVEG